MIPEPEPEDSDDIDEEKERGTCRFTRYLFSSISEVSNPVEPVEPCSNQTKKKQPRRMAKYASSQFGQ